MKLWLEHLQKLQENYTDIGEFSQKHLRQKEAKLLEHPD